MNQLLDRYFDYTVFEAPSRRGRRQTHCRLREQQLAKKLYETLLTLGLQDVSLSKEGAVSGWLPGKSRTPVPALGFIAPLQPADGGACLSVSPQIVENYRGGDIALGLGDDVLSPVRYPLLHQLHGQTIVTGDGSCAPGCEATAGIAEIVTLLTELKRGNQAHGDIHVAFIPAGESGQDALVRMSQRELNVDYAWCLSGGAPGELAWENHNVVEAVLTLNRHAHRRDTSALSMALAMQGEWQAKKRVCQQEALAKMRGDIQQAELHYQFVHKDMSVVEGAINALTASCQRWQMRGFGEMNIHLTHQLLTRNMSQLNATHPAVIDMARQAIADQGLTVTTPLMQNDSLSVVLATAGIPCVQLFSGGYNLRTPHEFITLEAMMLSVNVLLRITELAAQETCVSAA